MTVIKVSSKMLRLPFHGCELDFIRNVCYARCCDAPSRPDGMLVSILPAEVAAIERRGKTVVNGILKPDSGCRGCPFKASDHLCQLHGTDDKPHGCKSSPFMLNQAGTLIVRNRYKLLPCFKTSESRPAYRAFSESLETAIGRKPAAIVTDHLDEGGGDLWVEIDGELYDRLAAREHVLAGRKE